MDIYDVLQRIVEARPFQDYERAEALKIIEQLRSVNAFGTMAKLVREDHEHDWIAGFGRMRCSVCSLEQPYIGERRAR